MAIAFFEFQRNRYWDWPKAIALGIPIPLALSYFAFFWHPIHSVRSVLVFTGFVAPQAYILIIVGVWIGVAIFVRKMEISFLSTLAIALIGVVGHGWSVILMHSDIG
jgi:hypothetical protein